MSYLDKFLTPEVIVLARVRSVAGSAKYDAPIGTEITADMEPQKIRASGVKPGQQLKTKHGYQSVGVVRKDRVRKGVIHVFGTNGELLLTIQSNTPVDIRVRPPEAKGKVALAAVRTDEGARRYGTPKGSEVTKEKTPLKAVNKVIEHASKAINSTTKPEISSYVKHPATAYTRSNWHRQVADHVKHNYPGASVRLRPSDEDGHVTLDMIKVDQKAQGQGLANKVMKHVLDVADAVGAKVSLTPTAELAKWYTAWGFKSDGDVMSRAPHAAADAEATSP